MNKKQRMIDTETYRFANVNPKQKFVGDCVVRAIALATNTSWEETVINLTEYGIKKGLIVNDKTLYPSYLESVGFLKHPEPKMYDNTKYLAKDYLSKFRNDEIIVANLGGHHVACIFDGKVIDVWNSSGQKLHVYYSRKITPLEKAQIEKRIYDLERKSGKFEMIKTFTL